MHSLPSALDRRLPEDLKVKVESGYLNGSLQRTQEGIHLFLNFLEEKYDDEFTKWLVSYIASKKAAQKAVQGE